MHPNENERPCCDETANCNTNENTCETCNEGCPLTVIRDEGVVDFFTVPDELAKKLSDLLTTKSIRQGLLIELIDKPVKYVAMEKMIIPIEDQISAIKSKITAEHVPVKYRSEKYMWYFAGYNPEGSECWIKEN